ncbi:putative late blight resistance protein homolog R1B-16 isoform X2 [Ipomoea triloba]|uniref:putative late blight resistance protein homolog R1B-16 isoform X2 n=1 Tax=Ipomoea triloba TaxID=35885 RepID=UPI00125E220F|nr:putative late blight resistance protein homolog R1B-16 isoform X2 [Ipomoea triloba]
MACVAVNSLVRTIELELLQPLPRPIVRQKQLIPGNEDLLQSLHRKLGFLIELFDENRMDGIQAIKDLETMLRDVAFRVEDEIEFLIVHLYDAEKDFGIADLFGETGYSFKLGCILEEAIRDIDAIHKNLSKVKMECVAAALQGIGIGWKTTSTVVAAAAASTTSSDGGVDVMMMAGVGDSSHHQHASHSQPQQGSSIMVGKNNDFHIVKAMLIQHSSKQQEIVSIQGMGGIGKTTLAKRVYEDPSVASRFDIRAWVVASQYHNKLQMLTDLLKSMGCVGSGTQEDQLAQQLYKKLMHQRYFVVIDDIWSVDAWNSVKACFPDNANDSRVLLTTRSAQVATFIGSNNDFSHQMQLLQEGESLNLFHEKTSKSLGSEFDMIGRQIVKKCKGLPLAIVVAAGLLSKLHTLDEWKNVAEVLNSSATTTIDEECSTILSSSYNHLPHSLKACFLYLSVFPEDEAIHVKTVVKLWVAEGLVKASKDMSFDAVARKHIQELKDRNLILVSRASSCGRKAKVFRMHDLLHSFCVREAKKENLLHVVYENDESTSTPKYFRWVSIQSGRFNRQTLYSSLKSCRSIFVFDSLVDRLYIFLNLKFGRLIRVVYNCNIDLKYLVHLRCLLAPPARPALLEALVISDPFCCWNLQSLSVRSIDKMSVLEFPQLQHLRSNNPLSDFPICFHQNLKSIGWLRADHCTKEFFTSIPYLEKVMIQSKGGWYDCINNIAYLHQLQSLSLYGFMYPLIPNNNCIVSCKNLMKLNFRCVSFEGKTFNNFSKLPKLEVLVLIKCKWIGGEWELLEKDSFDQLIYLNISSSYLERWEASASHFPNLEHLILSWCEELEKIPAEFAEIPNLKSIKLYGCLQFAVDSANEIQREQHEQGNDNMVVIEENTIKENGWYSSH